MYRDLDANLRNVNQESIFLSVKTRWTLWLSLSTRVKCLVKWQFRCSVLENAIILLLCWSLNLT